MGYLIALTGSAEINNYAINKFGKQFGENGAFRLISPEEMENEENIPQGGLFSDTDDFNSFTEVATKYPSINEINLMDKTQYYDLIDITNKDKNMIPLFLKDGDGELHIISSANKEIDKVGKGWRLVYLGNQMDMSKITKR